MHLFTFPLRFLGNQTPKVREIPVEDQYEFLIIQGFHEQPYNAKTIQVMPKAVVIGSIKADHLEICGDVRGNVNAGTFYNYENAFVIGDIHCTKACLYTNSMVIGNVYAEEVYYPDMDKYENSTSGDIRKAVVVGRIIKEKVFGGG